MTETARRLARLARPHARRRSLAIGLGTGGAALAAAALGIALAPHLFAIAAAWAALPLLIVAGPWLARRLAPGTGPAAVSRMVETAAGARRGSVSVLTGAASAGTSAALFADADRRAADLVVRAERDVHTGLGRGTARSLAAGTAAAVVGAALFIGARPTSARAAAFWHPLRAFAASRAPLALTVDRARVRRGDRVLATIAAPGAVRATLWTRAPGESWTPTSLILDSTGHASHALGPLTADLFVRATSGARASAELRVQVATPAFVADVGLTARYPAYLARLDEPLSPAADTIPIPAGTVLLTDGAASVALARAAWTRVGGGPDAPLAVSGARFAGRFAPAASGVWRLAVATADGSPVEGDPPVLALRIIPDSAPVVAIAVPAADTTLPLTLEQPLVVDARDDHALSRVALESWRVSQTGKIGDTVRLPLPLAGANDRAILQAELDARDRGLLPGDTLRFRVEAWDNAPTPHRGRSREIALRLPSLEDLRAATRAAAGAVSAQADSVAASARSLAGDTRDLAAERARRGAADSARDPGRPTGSLSFEQTQRAAEIARRQAELGAQVRELSKAMDDLARAAQAAGVNDTAFQARLAEVQRLLAKAMTPELAQRLQELQDAMARLDPDATRRALQRLADAQEELKQQLTRTEELFRRAAVEGQLGTLAADAEELRRRQAEWNATDAPRADSGAAAHERALADRADSLAHALAQTAQDLPPVARDSSGGAPGNAARAAQGAMQQAAGAAQSGDANAAAQHGADAERALRGLPEALKVKRDSLAAAWKRETVEALDRALTETAELARRQQAVADALARGEGGASTRAAQASVEEGATAVARQIRDAAGKHALVSPGLDAALGFAQRQMAAARSALEQAQPNAQQAGELADEAVDALNATALALARSAEDVRSAKSGSGLPEAIEQLAKMAGQQKGLNGDAQGLLPMAGQGGDQMLQQMRALAARQRALAEELERLRAGGATSAAGPLAEEARELARQLDAGRLDPQTLARQQQLYRRLLDAGRSLTGPETDEQRDRVSRAAEGDSVHVPPALRAGATGAAGIPYPSWAELQRLTPEQRRQVLEYFRRLNAPPAH